MKYFLSILFGAIISIVIASIFAVPFALAGKIHDDFRKNAHVFMFICLWFFMIQLPIWFAVVYEALIDKNCQVAVCKTAQVGSYPTQWSKQLI